uniref:Uncharacterized protein n=1 Tax=Marmota marmota marmota TaxID=9994 RepID=A0A8C5Z4X1_MARMA
MASEAASAASVLTLALPLKELQHLAAQLRLLLPGVRDEEPQETPEEFNQERFWRRLNEAAV